MQCPTKKTMLTLCIGWFAPKYAFLGTYRPCRLIWSLVGWLVVGFGVQSVSRKTPIYFISYSKFLCVIFLWFVYLSWRIVSPLGSWSVLPHPATTAVLFLVIWSYVGRQTAPLHIISTHCWTKTWNRKTLFQPSNQQGTKWAGKAYICPNMSIWGQKRPFFHISKNHLCTLFALFFGCIWQQIHSKNVFVSGIQMNFWGPGPFF